MSHISKCLKWNTKKELTNPTAHCNRSNFILRPSKYTCLDFLITESWRDFPPLSVSSRNYTRSAKAGLFPGCPSLSRKLSPRTDVCTLCPPQMFAFFSFSSSLVYNQWNQRHANAGIPKIIHFYSTLIGCRYNEVGTPVCTGHSRSLKKNVLVVTSAATTWF